MAQLLIFQGSARFLDCEVLVSNQPLETKQKAYQQIINTEADMPAHRHFKEQKSIHDYLEKLIAFNNVRIKQFYDATNKIVYVGREYPSIYGYASINEESLESFEDALEHALSGDEGYRFVTVDKIFINGNNGSLPYIRMYFNRKGKAIGFREGNMRMVEIGGTAYFTDGVFHGHKDAHPFDNYSEQLDLLFDIYCYLPVPFERGDLIKFEPIYCDDNRIYDNVMGMNSAIGVFDSVKYPSPLSFVDRDYRIGLRAMRIEFWHMSNDFLRLDYDAPYGNFYRYKGELPDNLKVLRTFGDFLKGREPIESFLTKLQQNLIRCYRVESV
jgi:hypothetical protein